MHSDHVEHTLPIMSFQDMEAVPLQVTYQSAIQSVIISGNENRRIRIGLQGIHFTFTDGAGLAERRGRGSQSGHFMAKGLPRHFAVRV